MMISNMSHNNKFKHYHVLIMIMSFLFQCVNSSTSTTIPPFLGNQLVAKADKQMIKCVDTDRHALLDFKATILRDRYQRLSTWGTKREDVDDCCEWMGVTCNNQTGRVTELDLNSFVLEGEISPSLLNLTSLAHLDLSYNHFNGTILESIGFLTELTHLDLSYNNFNGNIPESISSLTELTHLDLSYNSLNGTIPVSIGSLTELRELDLSENSLTGTIPASIGSLTELRELCLSANFFVGTIPASIGSLTKLRELCLSGNSFIGTIPASIGSLTELRSLSLSNNSLNGTIRLEFGNLVNLEQLSLYDFERCSVGNISWLSRLSRLEELDMSNTSLAKADHWVNTILSLQNLTRLTLDGSDLSQVMHPYSSSSSHVNSSSNIVSLYLRDNNLNSSMYPWLYPLTRSNRLEYLYLDGNKLDEIPKYLGNLCHLKVLYFNNNSALAPFSEFLKNLSAGCTPDTLQSLQASSSQFTGSISDDIQHFSSLQELNLEGNQLNGTIREKTWELPNLQGIDVSSNSLRGAIFVKTANLNHKYIDLSKNKLYGGISFLCQNVDWSLTFLDLSHNSFFGQIPDCLWHLKELKILNLAHNNLSGRLPASVEYLIELEVLYLYNNFSGELPLPLRNCSMLNFLDLGANKFSGKVPVWIGENLSGLYVLNLGTNNFSGPIPLQICQLENLQILDLSMNGLNETIPSCINNLTSMVQEGFLSAQIQHAYSFLLNASLGVGGSYANHAMIQWQGSIREFTSNLGLLKSIDLSSNNLTGEIPNELTDLHGLLALNLSKNALLGEIPHKIGEMKEVQILDLSGNNLSGGLPSSMSELNFLNYLDVSYNNLTGSIPRSTQLQSFGPSRYIGNAGLCGPPLLTKSCLGDEELERPSTVGEGEGDELETWFYIGGAIGFGIGFWMVCSTLLVNRRGRHKFFHFMDK